MLRINRWLVCKLPEKWTGTQQSNMQLNWTYIDVFWLEQLFKNERRLFCRFNEFLKKGFIGIVWYNDNGWASYAWMSLPGTQGPPHLSSIIGGHYVYWVFYCRTKEDKKGRGLFKASLTMLAGWARARDIKAEVYIDTDPNNIPSRRAIETVGFSPNGIITAWTLRIPKVNSNIWGHWDPNATHTEVVR